MKDLLLQPSVKKHLQSIIDLSPQAVLLHGRVGVGLYTTANSLAQLITSKSSIATIKPDEKGSIKIKTIRELYSQTRTKHTEKLVIIIDDADTMLQPAQNALLKLLEEPPEHVVFILTAHTPQILLPTILSRVQKLEILPISTKQTSQLLATLDIKGDKKLTQINFMALGLPAEIIRLSNDSDYFDARTESIKAAREFIQGSVYKKLITSYKIGNDRDKAMYLLQDAAHIAQVSIKQKPSSDLAGLLSSIVFTQEKLLADGNIRSQLLRLSLN
ncbi:MAG: AAA family ATPase [Candidatus Saccharibacteria bacterium]|nr:AAA family ATPase [Candidatus Saccharibacteria bacterium]